MTHPMSEPWLDWQPEDTAPKNGELVLVCGGDLQRPALTWWHPEEGWMNGDGWSGTLRYRFARWARIPPPQS